MKVVDKKMIRKCSPADTDEDQQPIVFLLPFAKGTSEMKKSMKQLSHSINNKKIHLCFQTKKKANIFPIKLLLQSHAMLFFITNLNVRGVKQPTLVRQKDILEQIS